MTRDSPSLFDHGIELFNRCEFYDCHEVLEEVWTPTRQPERWFLQALIHFAVGFYHHRRGNPAGATRQLRKGLRKIQAYLPEWGGVRTEVIEQEARRCLDIIERGGLIETFPRIERCGPYTGHDYLLEAAAKASSSDRIL
jgi:predicted metal-dependent hydrolase